MIGYASWSKQIEQAPLSWLAIAIGNLHGLHAVWACSKSNALKAVFLSNENIRHGLNASVYML